MAIGNQQGIAKTEASVTYLIVTWNNAETIVECIGSILEFDKNAAEIIVVDNCSSDGTQDLIRREFCEAVTLVDAGMNLGFAAANNLGLTQVKTKYVCFFNPDAILIEDACSSLIGVLASWKNAGIVAPMLVYLDGSYQRSHYRFHSPLYQIAAALGFRRIGNMIMSNGGFSPRIGVVDWAIGAVLVMTTLDALAVGGFSEDYFMYTEDMDLCMKVKRILRKDTVYYPAVQVVHIAGVSESSNGAYRKDEKLRSNNELFADKYYPLQSWILKPLVNLSFKIRDKVNGMI